MRRLMAVLMLASFTVPAVAAVRVKEVFAVFVPNERRRNKRDS